MQTDKEKITEILKAYTKKHNIMASSVILEEYAEELIANGVIVPKREKDEHKIQIGDVLYEDSYSYGKVFEWKVLDIWLENYISGNKTIVKCSNGSWTKEFFVADVLQFHKTKEEAEAKLKELSNENK